MINGSVFPRGPGAGCNGVVMADAALRDAKSWEYLVGFVAAPRCRCGPLMPANNALSQDWTRHTKIVDRQKLTAFQSRFRLNNVLPRLHQFPVMLPAGLACRIISAVVHDGICRGTEAMEAVGKVRPRALSRRPAQTGAGCGDGVLFFDSNSPARSWLSFGRLAYVVRATTLTAWNSVQRVPDRHRETSTSPLPRPPTDDRGTTPTRCEEYAYECLE
jgi:hypothetical protein